MKKFFKYAKIIVLIIETSIISANVKAQNWIEGTYSQLSSISTVQISSSADSLSTPAVVLGAEDFITLQFDEFDADIRTLYYTLRHCNIDWQPSDLLDIEFYDGFNKVYDADQNMLSFNTTTDYTHYTLSIATQPIKVSGNYIVTVYSSDDDTELLRRPFFVYEPIVGIKSRVTRQQKHDLANQSLSLSVIHQQIHTNNAAIEFRIAAWQNCRPDTWVTLDQPTFVRQNEIVFDDAVSFEAGNEYRWADNRNLKYNGINVKHIDFFDPLYHITLYADKRDIGYSFHEDFNGRRYIEARDIYRHTSYGADYNMVHFTLLSEKLDGDVYVFGELTDFLMSNRNKMQYDETSHCYRLALQLKQGLHNYQYLLVDQNNNVSANDTDGSFTDTENDYYIAVYYRPLSETHDRLVGYKKHNSKNSVNSFVH